MEDKPKLEKALFTFYQEGNCVDGGMEELTIRCESSLGIDNDEGCFYVLKTKQWSIDSVKDLQKLFDRISKVVKKVEIHDHESPKTDFLERPIDQIFTEVDIADAIYMSKVGVGSVNGSTYLTTHQIIEKLKDRKWPK